MNFKCNTCGGNKPTAEFYKASKLRRGHYATCRLCWDERSRLYRHMHKEKCSQTRARWAKKNKNKKSALSRKSALKTRYGLSVEAFHSLHDKQEGKCAICQTPLEIASARVDHCHSSGTVRGLLCNSCNIGLGAFRDDPTRLIAAAEFISAYLETLS
jgi:hypothetical protein